MSATTMAHTPASPRRKTKTLPRRGRSSSQGRGRNRTSSRHIGKHRRHSLLPQADGLTGFLRHLLDQLHLDRVDTGDLLLLGLLFFLFKEDADEELLVALGLLLIL